MKIGNNELSDSEFKWCQNFAADILNQAKKQITSALNIRVLSDDVAVLLMEIWSKPEDFIEEPSHDEISLVDEIENIGEEEPEDDE